MKKYKKLKSSIIILLSFFIVVEIGSRYYGLNDYPLFERNSEYEYIHIPNQNRLIYRNKFLTNQFSMRSDRISDKDTLVVLLIGDSILNGGPQVDQDCLASTILQKKLAKSLGCKDIKVLNISSYSWGPNNIYKYLLKNGLFSADLAVIIHNSADAFDHMTFKEPLIGNRLKKPSMNYSIATFKAVEQLFFELYKKILPKKNNEVRTNSDTLDVGFSNLATLFERNKIPYTAYLHADLNEFNQGKYNTQGNLIKDFYNTHNIEIIEELSYKGKLSYYLDDIHFNSGGQEYMADILYPKIYGQLKLKIIKTHNK